MAKDNTTNTYEEARKQRVLDNKKRFEDLGILSISKSLSDISKSEKKSKQRLSRPKPNDVYMVEPRRSSRVRTQVASYRDDVTIDVDLSRARKRSKWSSSWTSYLARPVEEVRAASYEERSRALESAGKLQSNLQSNNPSFVKSMVRSHVYSCFWLGLPSCFCEDHLPKSTTDMVLEDEEGSEYEAVYISKRSGLSGGWRAFALDHKLDDGDALVFELIEPTRFKVYIVRAASSLTQAKGGSDAGETPKDSTKQRNKNNAPPKDLKMSEEVTQEKGGSDAGETLKERTKQRCKDKAQTKEPKLSKKDGSSKTTLGRRQSSRLK